MKKRAYKETENPNELQGLLLATWPKFRGKYVRGLIRKVYDKAIELNKTEMIFNVFSINENALDFYRKAIPRIFNNKVGNPVEKSLEPRISKITGNEKQVIRFTYALNKDVGGIDLNPNMLDIQTQGKGMEFNVPINAQTIQAIQIDGFSPVIFQIVPTNLPLLLSSTQKEKQLSTIQ